MASAARQIKLLTVLRPFLQFIMTLIVPVLLVMVSVRLLMTDAYLNIEYHKPDFPADYYGFTLKDRLYYAPFAIQYITGNEGIKYLADLRKPDNTPFYNQHELDHMVDVKRVAQIAFIVMDVAGLVFFLLLFALSGSAETRRIFQRGLFSGGMITLILLAGLLFISLTYWDSFFTQFHELFFANGTWLFDYSDSLIRLFPVRFWQDAALTIGGMSAGEAVLAMGVAWWWSHRDARGPTQGLVESPAS